MAEIVPSRMERQVQGAIAFGTLAGAFAAGARMVAGRPAIKMAVAATVAGGSVGAMLGSVAKAEPAAKPAAAPAPAAPAAAAPASQSTSSFVPSVGQVAVGMLSAGLNYGILSAAGKFMPMSTMAKLAVSVASGVVSANGPLARSTPEATPSTTPSGSTDLARQAAARTASDMGQRQTVGAPTTSSGSGSSNSSAEQKGDGRVDGYTRIQNGHTVQVTGYALPASRR